MIVDILNQIKLTAGSNDKKKILREHIDNDLLKKVLVYGLDPYDFQKSSVNSIVDSLLLVVENESPHEPHTW